MKSKELRGKIGIVARTHVGKLRTNNEDYHTYSPNILKKVWHFYDESVIDEDTRTLVLLVADGMGGLAMGEEASQRAVKTSEECINKHAETLVKADIEKIKSVFTEIFEQVNEAVLSFAREQNKAGELGTTLIITYIHKKIAHVFWLGDSRSYLIRKGRIQSLSKDHSYVQDLVDEGRITYDQAFYHPDSNIITKYIGDPKSKAKPSYASVHIETGDIILMCSDGLNGMLPDERIEAHFRNNDDLSDLCQNLIEDANAEGGNDNTTIILASFGDFASYIPVITENTGKQLVNNKERNTKILPGYKLQIKRAVFLFLAGLVTGGVIMYGLQQCAKKKTLKTEHAVLQDGSPEKRKEQEEDTVVEVSDRMPLGIDQEQEKTDKGSVNMDRIPETKTEHIVMENALREQIDQLIKLVEGDEENKRISEAANALLSNKAEGASKKACYNSWEELENMLIELIHLMDSYNTSDVEKQMEIKNIKKEIESCIKKEKNEDDEM